MVKEKAKVVWQHKLGQEIFRGVKHKDGTKDIITFEQFSRVDSLGNEIWLEPETETDFELLKETFARWLLKNIVK